MVRLYLPLIYIIIGFYFCSNKIIHLLSILFCTFHSKKGHKILKNPMSSSLFYFIGEMHLRSHTITILEKYLTVTVLKNILAPLQNQRSSSLHLRVQFHPSHSDSDVLLTQPGQFYVRQSWQH